MAKSMQINLNDYKSGENWNSTIPKDWPDFVYESCNFEMQFKTEGAE